MKKLFIGLLIVAAGAGAFYFLQKKKTETKDNFEKELLIGKWKVDSIYSASKDSTADLMSDILMPADSSFRPYSYNFQKSGEFLQSVYDSVKADTSYYEWGKRNELVIKDAIKDSTGELYTVNKLSLDSLILQTKDSAVFVLTKLK